MKIAIISTTSHSSNSTSKYILAVLKGMFEVRGYKVRVIDASQLHVVNNLSCYSSGKSDCASYDAGKYRCWAHKLSHDTPSEYGGKDQMGSLYDAYDWADIVIFGTSVRWESHSAILQKIIERMTTLQNRDVVYGERNPLQDKRCGVVVTGHNSMAQNVAAHLLRVFEWLGFTTNIFYQIVWQNTQNIHSEVPDTSDLPALEKYLKSNDAHLQIEAFVDYITFQDN